MDPIHPIRPTSPQPAPVDRVRRVTRAGDQEPRDDQPQPRRDRARGAGAPTPPQPDAGGDGHVDALA